jgi:hypothetical protein
VFHAGTERRAKIKAHDAVVDVLKDGAEGNVTGF